MNIKEQKQQHLLQAYNNTLKTLGNQARYMSRKAIILLTINTPAPMFYVSPETACRYINNIEKYGQSKAKSTMANRQYEAIYRNYLQLKSKLIGYQKIEIISRAVNMPAECFYIELSSAITLFCTMKP